MCTGIWPRCWKPYDVAACSGVHGQHLGTKGTPSDHAPALGAARNSVPGNCEYGQIL